MTLRDLIFVNQEDVPFDMVMVVHWGEAVAIMSNSYAAAQFVPSYSVAKYQATVDHPSYNDVSIIGLTPELLRNVLGCMLDGNPMPGWLHDLLEPRTLAVFNNGVQVSGNPLDLE